MSLLEKAPIAGEMVKIKAASDKVKKELFKMVEQDEEIQQQHAKGEQKSLAALRGRS